MTYLMSFTASQDTYICITYKSLEELSIFLGLWYTVNMIPGSQIYVRIFLASLLYLKYASGVSSMMDMFL